MEPQKRAANRFAVLSGVKIDDSLKKSLAINGRQSYTRRFRRSKPVRRLSLKGAEGYRFRQKKRSLRGPKNLVKKMIDGI